MKRLLIGGLSVLGIIVLLVLAGPGLMAYGVLGPSVEETFRANLQAMSVPGLYKFEVTKYENGWFGAKARTKLALDGALAESYERDMAEMGMPAQNFEITFSHDIQHGPLLFTGDGPKLAAGYAETGMNLPPLIQIALIEYLQGKPFLTIKTSFGFSGGSYTRISNPSYNGVLPDDTTIRWDGIDGTFDFDGENLTTDMSMPLFQVESPEGGGKIEDIRYKGEHKKISKHMWAGEGTLSIPKIEVDAPDAQVDIEDVDYTTIVELDDDGWVSFAVRLGLEKAVIDDAKLGKTGYEIELTGFSPAAIDELYDVYYALLGSDMEDPEVLIEQARPLLMEALPKLFEGPAGLSMAFELDIESPEAKFKGRSEAAIKGSSDKISVTVEQTVDSAEVPDIGTIEDSAFQLTLSGLEGRALSELYGDISEILLMDIPEWQREEEIALATEAKLPGLLGPDTQLALDNLAVNLPDGKATASGSVGFAGDGPIDVNNPGAMMMRLAGGLSARIDESALVWVLSREKVDELMMSFTDAGRDISPELIEKLAADAARSDISTFEAQSFIKRDGDSYTLEVEFAEGMLKLNGIERPDLMGR